MRFWCPVSEHVFRQELTREGRRLSWQQLFFCCNFPGHIARGILAGFNRKQRLAICSIGEINEALLRDLRDRFSIFPVMLDGDKRGGGREITIPDVVLYPLEVPDAFSS